MILMLLSNTPEYYSDRSSPIIGGLYDYLWKDKFFGVRSSPDSYVPKGKETGAVSSRVLKPFCVFERLAFIRKVPW